MLLTGVGDAEQAATLAIAFDPAIAAAQQAVNAARKGVDREKGSWWPEVDFVYNSQYSDVGFDNLTSPPRSSESYSISMRYPLFEGGAGLHCFQVDTHEALLVWQSLWLGHSGVVALMLVLA